MGLSNVSLPAVFGAIERDRAIGGSSNRAPEVGFGAHRIGNTTFPIQKLAPAQRDRRPIDVDRRVAQPLRLFRGQCQLGAIVILVLNLLRLSDVHVVTAPGVGEEAGKIDVVDGVLADHEDLVPVVGGNSPASPAGAGRGVADMLDDEQLLGRHADIQIRILRCQVLALGIGDTLLISAAGVPHFVAVQIRLDGDVGFGSQSLPRRCVRRRAKLLVRRKGDDLVPVHVSQSRDAVDNPRAKCIQAGIAGVLLPQAGRYLVEDHPVWPLAIVG